MGKNEIIFNKHKIRILEDSVLIDSKILVFGDLHLGYEELYARGGNFPMVQLGEIKEKIKRIFSIINQNKKKIKKIVIIGDFIHSFGKISNSEFKDINNFLKFLENLIKRENIIFIKGNHDTTSSIIIKKSGFKIKDYYKIKDILLIHGDKFYKDKIKNVGLLIMGHLHPTIRLRDKYKQEKYKCFLSGKWKKISIFILPSFMNVNYGYNLNNTNNQKNKFSFIENKLLKNFQVIIYNEKEDKYYSFGRLNKLL